MSAGGEEFAIDPATVREWKRYQAYKDSGVEWLGEVPAGWEVSSIKRHFLVQLGKMLQSEPSDPGDKLMPYLRAANISWEKILVDDIKEMWFSESEKERYRIENGDLLVSEGGDVGRATLWNGELDECYIQNAINRVRSRNGALTSHLHYWLYFLKHVDYIDMLCNKATIAHYTAEKVMNTVYFRPPLPEQHAIAAFLDRETARLDALIAKKQRFIELLEEKRQALITQAVTKGLDPDADMKDSGVEWLGEVPGHWDIWQIGHFARVGNGSTPSRSNAAYWINGIYPWLNSSCVNHGLIRGSNQFVTKKALEECHLPCVPPGSILVAITGQGKTRGTAAILDIKATINQHLAFVTPEQNIVSPEYLQLIFTAAYRELRRISDDTGSTKGALTCEDISHFKVALPPLKEQEWLITTILSKLQSIAMVITSNQRQISLLYEYRTALISAAVTGNIDVRSEAPATP